MASSNGNKYHGENGGIARTHTRAMARNSARAAQSYGAA